jgi:hypothetical protein
MALGMLVPVAFAASTTTGLKKASQLPIVVNGSALSNPFEMTGLDSGNTTGFFPIYYFNQALAKIGFAATWDGVNHVWNISAPNVTAAPVAGGVGTGNTTVTVNGTVVKKFNTQAAKDPAGSQVTTYLPIFYINNVLSALGVKGTFSGQTGLSVTSAQSTMGAGLSAIMVSGATNGDGSQSSPAVSLNNAAVTLSTTLTDANGNALTNTAVTFSVSNYGNYPTLPTVESASGVVISGTQQTNAEQYTAYTDGTGTASISVTGPSSTTYAYQVVATAPYQSSNGMAVSSQSAYVEFVANNQVGLTPYANSSTPFNASLGTPVPVTVTLPPNASGNAQANALVTLTTSGHASFVSSTGVVLGQQIQVSTNASGIAQANLSDSYGETVTVSVSNLPVGNNAPSPTYINFAQAGVPAKISNLSVSTNSPSIGTNVVVSGQLQDASGNAVANGQILVTSPNNASNHFSYLSGTTTTEFPLISSVAVGTPATSAYGELVTADAAGNFNFSLTNSRVETQSFYIYAVANGQVESSTPLNGTTTSNNNTVAFTASTNLAYLSVGSFDSYVQANSDTSVTSLTALANAGGNNPTIASNNVSNVFVEPQSSAGHHTGGVLNTTAETYSLSANNGGLIYSINGTKLTNPAGAITVSYDGAGNFTVGGQTIAQMASPAQASDFEVGVTNANTGATKLTVQSGTISSTASITFNGGTPNQIATFNPGTGTINGGASEVINFQVQDANGNPSPNTSTTVQFDQSALATNELWLTQVNGANVQESLDLETGGQASYSTVNTPIPLGVVPGALNYSVSDQGVVSWTHGANTLSVTSDGNGNVSLTLQAGGLSYPTQYVAAGPTPGVLANNVAADSNGQVAFWTDTNGDPGSVPLFISAMTPAAYVAGGGVLTNSANFSQIGSLSWGNGTPINSSNTGVNVSGSQTTASVANMPSVAYVGYGSVAAGDSLSIDGNVFSYGTSFTTQAGLISAINAAKTAGLVTVTASQDSTSSTVIDLSNATGSTVALVGSANVTVSTATIPVATGGTDGVYTLNVLAGAVNAGNLAVTVNGHAVSVPVAQFASASIVAGNIIADLNADPTFNASFVAAASGSTGLTITQKSPSATAITVSVQG